MLFKKPIKILDDRTQCRMRDYGNKTKKKEKFVQMPNK